MLKIVAIFTRKQRKQIHKIHSACIEELANWKLSWEKNHKNSTIVIWKVE